MHACAASFRARCASSSAFLGYSHDAMLYDAMLRGGIHMFN